jgi:hypothetical protein
MSTVLVALTALDKEADHLLDELAATFPVSSFRGTPGVWLVEVDEDGDAAVEHAQQRVGAALSSISQSWQDVLTVGATGDGIRTE